MQGANIGARNYICTGQLMIEQATTEADAQATAEAAAAAINTALHALDAPAGASLSFEVERGEFVFSESG